MKTKLYIMISLALIISFALSVSASFAEDEKLPEFPGAKLLTERILPAGKALDSIVKEFAPWLGLSEIKQVSIVTYTIGRDAEAQNIFKFYEPSINEQHWKTLVRSFDRDSATAVMFNDVKGMLIMNIDPPRKKDRQIAIVRVFGKIIPDIGNPERGLPDKIKQFMDGQIGPDGNAGELQNLSRIPTGQPISVPPSEWLQIKSTRSDIKAKILNQSTMELNLSSRTDDTGELIRTDEGLLLSFAPRLPIEEILLPGAVPVIIQLTEGSLVLSCGNAPSDRPVRMSVTSTSAPVTFESFPLVSGKHLVKSVGGKVSISFSQVQGGVFDADVTGEDLNLFVPRDASAAINISAPAGRIQNMTSAESHATADGIGFQMGAGKAIISLKAVNGTVCVRATE